MKKDNINEYIYIGCQILNRSLFENYKVNNFSISEIWNILLKNELNGFESFNEFYHLTNLETFKKLKDLALSLSRYSHLIIFSFSLSSRTKGFVGISKLEI